MLVNLDHVPKLPGCKYYLKQNSLPWCCWFLIEPSNPSYGLNGKVQRLRSAPTAKSWRISSKNGKSSWNSGLVGLVGCKPRGFVMFGINVCNIFVPSIFEVPSWVFWEATPPPLALSVDSRDSGCRWRWSYFDVQFTPLSFLSLRGKVVHSCVCDNDVVFFSKFWSGCQFQKSAPAFCKGHDFIILEASYLAASFTN